MQECTFIYQRLVVALCCFAVVSVSCGEGVQIFAPPNEPTATAPTSAAALDPSPVVPATTAEALVSNLEPSDSIDGLMLAINAGYGIDQIVGAPQALDAAGTLTGVTPTGGKLNLVAGTSTALGYPVTASIALSMFAPPGRDHTLDEIRTALSTRLLVAATLRVLRIPLGDFGPESRVEDVAAPPSTMATDDGARVMIGVLLSLMDLGYSFDQALNGYIFGEWAVALGVDPTGKTSTGVTMGLLPVALCIVLIDDTGGIVRPDLAAPSSFNQTATCRAALDADLLDTDGVDEVIAAAIEDSSPQASGPDESDGAPVVYLHETFDDVVYHLSFGPGAGTPLNRDRYTEFTLELYPDGVAVMSLRHLDRLIAVYCNEGLVNLEVGVPPVITEQGSHADGSYEIPALGVVGTYTARGAAYIQNLTLTSDECPQGTIQIEKDMSTKKRTCPQCCTS